MSIPGCIGMYEAAVEANDSAVADMSLCDLSLVSWMNTGR